MSSGFNVLSASNGADGLSLIIKENPDLVLLDLVMPGMSGFEVLTTLNQKGISKKIPIIVLSNLSQNSDIIKAKELGALDYYRKDSIDLAQLTKKITKILGE